MTIDVNLSQTINEIIKSRYTKEVSDSVQRLTSGLKINDTADDSAGLVSVNSLKGNSSSLSQGIESGNKGLALVQVSQNSLTNQENILNSIQERLTLATDGTLSSTSLDALRVDIIDLISQLDEIAQETNYNENYTLQQSASDSSTSSAVSLFYDENSGSTILSPEAQANSTGLSLSTLENLSSGELTQAVAVTQSAVISDAITSVQTYNTEFELSKTQIGISVDNLTSIEKTTSEARDKLLKTNTTEENAILDKYKLLEQSSEFAIVQANITQAAVLRLLTDVVNVESEPTSNNTNYDNDDENSFYNNSTNDKQNNNFFKSSFESNSYESKSTQSSYEPNVKVNV